METILWLRADLGLEVEEGGEGPAVGEPRVGVPQLVEEGVHARLECGAAQRGGVLQQAGHQVHGLGGHPLVEHLGGGEPNGGSVCQSTSAPAVDFECPNTWDTGQVMTWERVAWERPGKVYEGTN